MAIVFFNFFILWFKRKQSFGPLKSYFWINPSFWLVETVSLVNYKPFSLIQSFFLLVDTILEIKCHPVIKEIHYSCSLKQFSWIFADLPASGSTFFWFGKMEFSSNPSTRLACVDFELITNRVLLFRAFFLLLESITEIRPKPVFFYFFSS